MNQSMVPSIKAWYQESTYGTTNQSVKANSQPYGITNLSIKLNSDPYGTKNQGKGAEVASGRSGRRKTTSI